MLETVFDWVVFVSVEIVLLFLAYLAVRRAIQIAVATSVWETLEITDRAVKRAAAVVAESVPTQEAN